MLNYFLSLERNTLGIEFKSLFFVHAAVRDRLLERLQFFWDRRDHPSRLWQPLLAVSTRHFRCTNSFLSITIDLSTHVFKSFSFHVVSIVLRNASSCSSICKTRYSKNWLSFVHSSETLAGKWFSKSSLRHFVTLTFNQSLIVIAFGFWRSYLRRFESMQMNSTYGLLKRLIFNPLLASARAFLITSWSSEGLVHEWTWIVYFDPRLIRLQYALCCCFASLLHAFTLNADVLYRVYWNFDCTLRWWQASLVHAF